MTHIQRTAWMHSANPGIAQSIQAARTAKSSSTATSPFVAKPATKKTPNTDSLATTLRQAVATALQKVKNNQAADPNDAVETALAKVLKATLSATKKASNSIDGSDSSDSSDSSAGSAVNDLTGAVASSASSPAAFSQLLQSNGITAQQFQQDLVSALQDASANSGNPNSLQSLPSGMLVDLLG